MAPRFISEAKFVSGAQIIAAFNPIKDAKSLLDFRNQFPSLIYETDSYEHFLEKIDAVYIASPNETHFDYAKKALLQGKHVLSENRWRLLSGKRSLSMIWLIPNSSYS